MMKTSERSIKSIGDMFEYYFGQSNKFNCSHMDSHSDGHDDNGKGDDHWDNYEDEHIDYAT